MPQSRCGGFVVIGDAAGTEIHKMGSPLGGEAGEFYQSFGGMGNGTESCTQLVPPPLRPVGGGTVNVTEPVRGIADEASAEW